MVDSDLMKSTQNPEIIVLYIEGLSINRIGEQLGISSVTPGDTYSDITVKLKNQARVHESCEVAVDKKKLGYGHKD